MYEAQKKNLIKAWEIRRVKKIEIICGRCGKKVLRYPRQIVKINFCSRYCRAFFFMKQHKNGDKLSEITKQKLRQYTGSRTSNWKGGKPKCSICKAEIGYGYKHCQKHIGIGKKLSEKHRQNISNSLIGIMPKNNQMSGKFMNVARGWYEIDGKRMFFRSKWEVNYALYLSYLVKLGQVKRWEYEADVFMFEKIKLGTRSYRPDFKVFNNDGTTTYHEVKGWMDPKSVTKIKRMAKYYPEIKLIVIDSDSYKDIKNKLGRLLKFY